MSQLETEPGHGQVRPVLSRCPQCDGGLTVLRVISGRAKSEYWTLRCTRCGGIHLDILQGA